MNHTDNTMHWKRLITGKRFGLEEYHDPRVHSRSAFRRDYDRMIFSSPFRRLQNKTQVFPLPGSIFVHNRLTHSLEVSSVGRSIANEVSDGLHEKYSKFNDTVNLDDIGDIVATACLCHDLGNPPFGHSGEKAIATFFSEGAGLALQDNFTEYEWHDLINFEGNANSLRLLTHQFCGRRVGGFAMTYPVLASIVKYPYPSTHAGEKGKFGFFSSEADTYSRIAKELGIIEYDKYVFARHPLVYIVEAADDICYQIMDIEDAHKLKILSTQEVKNLFMNYFSSSQKMHSETIMCRLSDPNEQIAYLRSNVIGNLVDECARVFISHEDEIMEGSFKGSLISHMTSALSDAYTTCSSIAFDKIYCAPHVVDVEIAGNRIITSLMEYLTDAVIHPSKNSSRLILNKFPQQYDTNAPTIYGKIQSVLDHVSAMTDVYALDLFRKINGHSLPAV